MDGVSAVAAWTKSVKSRNPDRGRKIPVRAASRGAFRQILPKLAGHLAGYSIETNHGGVAFKRRAVDAPVELEPRPRQHRTQRSQLLLDGGRVLHGQDAHVDARARDVSDDVRARSTGDAPDVERDTPLRTLQRGDGDNLVREFVNRARAFSRIEAGVRRHAVNRELELAAALAARFDRAARQRRLEDEHGRTLAAPASR